MDERTIFENMSSSSELYQKSNIFFLDNFLDGRVSSFGVGGAAGGQWCIPSDTKP